MSKHGTRSIPSARDRIATRHTTTHELTDKEFSVITIDYFSDVLCVWAYGGQVRLDELRREFGADVYVRERFTPLFSDTPTKIGKGWSDRDGFPGFARHTSEVCSQWDHARLSPEVWDRVRPVSSSTAHLFLRAVGLCLGLDNDKQQVQERQLFARLSTRIRCAFFEEGKDIAQLSTLMAILGSSDPSEDAVRSELESGRAAAALHQDAMLAEHYGVRGSPSYVINEGRQVLFGNLGYRIIEANLRELLAAPLHKGEPSWC